MNGVTVTVKMAEMDVIRNEGSLKTILGSCVGVILRDADRRVSGLAHIMLPLRHSDDAATGKYADSAIPALLARVLASGARQAALQAFIIGGAQMFPLGNIALSSIGDQNVDVARRILKDSNIPVIFEDIGGTAGRAVLFDNVTGKVSVRTLHPIQRKGETA
jgi:chemotaxis protein CheD